MTNEEYSLCSISITMCSESDIIDNAMLLDYNIPVCLAPSLAE